MQGILPIPLNLAKSRDSNFRSLLGKFWLAYVWHLTYLAQLTYTVDNVCVEILWKVYRQNVKSVKFLNIARQILVGVRLESYLFGSTDLRCG